MGDVITQSKIWKFVGRVSAVTGLVCFPISSSYDKSFGKLGKRGHLSYLVFLLVCLFVWILIVHFKRIRVSNTVQLVFVAVLSFDVLCMISVLHDNLVPGKSDAWSIISYFSFALMSLSVSRKLELGLETGFSAFFLQLFAFQLYKIHGYLFPIAIVFCNLVIILRYYPASELAQSGSSINEESLSSSLSSTSSQESNQEGSNEAHHPTSNNGGVSEESILDLVVQDQQNNHQEETSSSFPARHRLPSNDGQSARPNGDHSQEVPLINGTASATDNHGDLDLELQDPPRVGQDLGESLSSTGNQENNPEESNEARHRHSPINYGQASEANISFSAEYSYSSEQDHVSSANYQNGYVRNSPSRQLLRRRRMTPVIQNIAISLGDTLRRWHPPHLFSFFLPLFFFFKSEIEASSPFLTC